MNDDRRMKIEAAAKELAELQTKLEAISDTIEEIQGEEEDYLSNMPENMQEGAKGQAALEAIANLEAAVEAVEGAIANFDEATSFLEEAKK